MPAETGLAHFMPIQCIAAVRYRSGGHGAAHEDEVFFNAERNDGTQPAAPCSSLPPSPNRLR